PSRSTSERLGNAARFRDRQTELRGPESAVSGPLRAVLIWDRFGGRSLSCARARQRPARAQSGLRLSPRCAGVLASGLSRNDGRNVSNLVCATELPFESTQAQCALSTKPTGDRVSRRRSSLTQRTRAQHS